MSLRDHFKGGQPSDVVNIEDSDDFVTYVAPSPEQQRQDLSTYKIVKFVSPMPSSALQDTAPIVPVSGPDDPRGSAYTDLTVENRDVSVAELTPKPCTWSQLTAEQIAEHVKAPTERVYCIKANIPKEKTNVIVWPDDKKHLQSIAYGLAVNPAIAKAFLEAGWEVQCSCPGGNTLAEVQAFYGISGGDYPLGPRFAVGGYWIVGEAFECTEIVGRWLIIDDVFKHLPEKFHSMYRDFECWGTGKERGISPGKAGGTPEPPDGQGEKSSSDSDRASKKPKKMVKYTVGGIDLLS